MDLVGGGRETPRPPKALVIEAGRRWEGFGHSLLGDSTRRSVFGSL